jgi:hypothetical protein
MKVHLENFLSTSKNHAWQKLSFTLAFLFLYLCFPCHKSLNEKENVKEEVANVMERIARRGQ